MSEQTQRRRIVKALRDLDAVSIENPAHPGTPDVNYIEGWIELKWLRRWPRNADVSPVLLEHYTQGQRVWHRRRARRGGRVFVLLQVGKEWLLFKGDTAALNLGKVTRPELYRLAIRHWDKGLKEEELKECLNI